MTLDLLAPFAGWVGTLAEAPDPAFAGGLVGDGVLVEPLEGRLGAPCAGEVVAVHRAGHAFTLRADNGAELLIHVGIDTVALGGDGFVPAVAAGDRVAAGDVLLRFDLDRVAAGAPSLATPVLLLDQPGFRIVRRARHIRVAAGDWLMAVEGTGTPPGTSATAGDEWTDRPVTIPPGHGIHARPAAAIVAAVRGFEATMELVSTKASVPATSAVGLMTLGLSAGDRVTLRARGPDAAAALAAVAAVIEGEAPPAAAPVVPRPQPAGGVTAVPGLAVGTVRRLATVRPEPPATGQGAAIETRTLDDALATVRTALRDRAGSGPPVQRSIADAHLALLDDPRFRPAAMRAMEAGASAGAAWAAALAPDIAALRRLPDPRLAGRADDLLDLERQVVAATLGRSAAAALPPGTLLVGDDLLPSELMALDPGSIAGIALAGGGPTSHVAIIAAARGLPMAVALGEAVRRLPDGARAVLDADAATLVAADEAAERVANERLAAAATARAADRAAAATPCRMADGTRIEVFANLGSAEEAEAAVAAGAEGCGLLRTELLFLDRERAPDEAEQGRLYQAIADRLDGRPLVIRTLDIGGDKPVPYLPLPTEENPALGLRGIRVGLAHPDLLDEQLRAILRVSPATQARILLPMIAGPDELRAVRARTEGLARAMGRTAPVALGVMIETPAAAIAADLLAPDADFFAIGTNDLAQYTLAMDRGNPAVAAQVDALHPAVLRLIGHAVRAAAAHNRPVGVCGGLASDLLAAPILLGLGVDELSAVPDVIPALKARVRGLSRARCAELATEALVQPSAAAVRALAAGWRP